MKRTAVRLLVLIALAGCGERPENAAEGSAGEAVDVAQEAQRVQTGMTEPQVVEILGEPRNRVEEGEGGERLTFWTFDASDEVRARVYVSFDSTGRVVNVETVPL